MKKILCAIIVACLNHYSFGQILEEYVPENLDVFESDTISIYLADNYGLEKYKSLFKAEKGEN